MGQQVSQETVISDISQVVSSPRRKLKAAMNSQSFLLNEEPCLNHLCTLHSDKNRDEKWKKETIKHLGTLKTDTWPGLLIKLLKQTNTQDVDTYLKSDMYCAIHNENENSNLSSLRKDSLNSFEESSFDCSRPEIRLIGENRIQINLFDDRKETDQTPRKKNSEASEANFGKHSFEHKTRTASARSCDLIRPIPITPKEKSKFAGSPFGRKASLDNDTIKEGSLTPISRFGELISTPKREMSEQYKSSAFFYSPTVREDDLAIKEQYDLVKCLKKYKSIINLLKKHLSSETSIFNKMINQFENFLVNSYGDAKTKLATGALYLQKIEENCDRASLAVMQFIDVLYEGINRYYKLERLRQKQQNRHGDIFCKDNMVRSLVSIVFNQKIYDVIFELYSIKNQEIKEKCKLFFDSMKESDPQHFGVPEKYALNETTLKFFRESILIMSKNVPSFTDETFCIGVNKQAEDASFEFQKDPETLPRIALNTSPSKPKQREPYEKCISKLSTITKQISPFYKFEILCKTTRIIYDSITDFYKGYGLILDEGLSKSDMSTIIFYLVAKSSVTDIYTHIQMISKFVPKKSIGVGGDEYIKIIENIVKFIDDIQTVQNNDDFENLGFKFQEFFSKSSARSTSSKQKNTFLNVIYTSE